MGKPGCRFSEVTIGSNEAVRIKTDPEYADSNKIKLVQFSLSSIHSIPTEIFTKFRNIIWFFAPSQNIQEIKPETFADANKLENINLDDNALTFLHKNTFKGKLIS